MVENHAKADKEPGQDMAKGLKVWMVYLAGCHESSRGTSRSGAPSSVPAVTWTQANRKQTSLSSISSAPYLAWAR